MLDAGSNGTYRRRMKPLFFLLSLLLPVLVVFSAKRPSVLLPSPMTGAGRHPFMPRSRGPVESTSVAKTPHFDKLAKSGVLFTNASVNAPSCTPCRSAILSGRNFWETGRGAILQGAVWDEKIPTWPLLLKDSGYHIGYTYKVWSPGTPGMPGLEDRPMPLPRPEGNSTAFPNMSPGGPPKGLP